MMLNWKLLPGFPNHRILILGVLLVTLGLICVTISVLGIMKVAWGHYVGTGIWGGVSVTLTGLTAIYCARVQSSRSAKLYFSLSIVTTLISFVMLVLSAGGLTYKSNFYAPVKLQEAVHQNTLIVHGTVLSVSVISLACNVLSVIVCYKFIAFEKYTQDDSFKMRRHRHRFTNPDAVYRISSLRGGGSCTARSSTNSRTSLYNSGRTVGHSRSTSFNDCNNSQRGERLMQRRDSDRSRGSSRSRHSHHRQSSSVSQQSRHLDSDLEPSNSNANVATLHAELPSASRQNEYDVPSVSLNERMEFTIMQDSNQQQVALPVFDPEEEPPPPYEETCANTGLYANTSGDVLELEASESSSAHPIDSSGPVFRILPLNIPVHEPDSEHRSESQQNHGSREGGEIIRTDGRIYPHHRFSPEPNTLEERDNRLNLQRLKTNSTGISSEVRMVMPIQTHPSPSPQRTLEFANDIVQTHYHNLPQDNLNVISLEICALTRERVTPDSHTAERNVYDVPTLSNDLNLPSQNLPMNSSAQASRLSNLSDSSDTSLHEVGESHAGITEAFSSRALLPLNSERNVSGPRCLVSPGGSQVPFLSLGSPNSAFRPVGRRSHHLEEGLSGKPVSPDTHFIPIVSPGSDRRGSIESLNRTQWKKIPLPSSHNHSGQCSDSSKTLAPKQMPVYSPVEQELQIHSLPRRGPRELGYGRYSDRSRDKFIGGTNVGIPQTSSEQARETFGDSSTYGTLPRKYNTSTDRYTALNTEQPSRFSSYRERLDGSSLDRRDRVRSEDTLELNPVTASGITRLSTSARRTVSDRPLDLDFRERQQQRFTSAAPLGSAEPHLPARHSIEHSATPFPLRSVQPQPLSFRFQQFSQNQPTAGQPLQGTHPSSQLSHSVVPQAQIVPHQQPNIRQSPIGQQQNVQQQPENIQQQQQQPQNVQQQQTRPLFSVIL